MRWDCVTCLLASWHDPLRCFSREISLGARRRERRDAYAATSAPLRHTALEGDALRRRRASQSTLDVTLTRGSAEDAQRSQCSSWVIVGADGTNAECATKQSACRCTVDINKKYAPRYTRGGTCSTPDFLTLAALLLLPPKQRHDATDCTSTRWRRRLLRCAFACFVPNTGLVRRRGRGGRRTAKRARGAA